MADILTLEEGRQAAGLGASNTTKDAGLAIVLGGITAAFDEAFGPIFQREIEDEAHNGGSSRIVLRHRPVKEITSVTEYRRGEPFVLTEETATVLPSDGFSPDDHRGGPLLSGVIRRRSYGCDYCFAPGRRNVLVTYTAGRFADEGAVTDAFKAAARLTLRNLWRSEEFSIAQLEEYEVASQNFPRFTVPNAALEMLHEERFKLTGYIR